MSSLGIFDKETKTYKKVADLSKTAVIDSAMSDSSTNAVQNKVVKKYVDDHTVVDSAMSDTSTKAVQNKVVKSYVDTRTSSVAWNNVTGKPSTYPPSSHTHTKSQITDFPSSLPANGGNSNTVNGHTVNSNVPANAKFTDTTYNDATTSAHGLMTPAMVSKLNGIAEGANRTTVDSGMSDTSTNPVQNKAVKSYVDGRTALDTAMSDTSTKAVQNKVVKSYVDRRTTFDSAMSDTSTNAVQNKIVKSYVDGRTTLDTSMSDTSTKAVQNKVVKSYVDGTFKQKLLASMPGDGKTSYCQLCTIKISNKYIDTPIEITVQERGRATLDRLTVLFQSSDNIDPSLISFKVFGEFGDWYISKRAASTWIIYGEKNELWANIRVVDYIGRDNINVTWDVTGVTALPDSKTKAVWGGNVGHAVSADSASSASTVNGHTVNSDVPSGAKFTDTTYSDATTSAHGLMTPAMVSKLNGIAEGANRTTVDSGMSDTSTNPVQNKVIKKYVDDHAPNITVDDALSTTSTNPVQNKVVTSNLVDLKKETTVNLLNPTLETTTQDGITCTNNGDGTYTLNGTVSSTSNRAVIVIQHCADMIKKHLNEDLLLIGCPKHDDSGNVVLHLDGRQSHAVDNGNGDKFKFSEVLGDGAIKIEIGPNGTTVNNLVFKPMITTNLNATYDDFVPYTGDTGKLNSDVAWLFKKATFERDNTVFDNSGLFLTGDTAGRFGAISYGWSSTEGYVIEFKNAKDEKTHCRRWVDIPAHSALFIQAYSPNSATVEVKSPLLFYNERDTVDRETISCDVTVPIGTATSIAFNPIVIKNV